MDIISRFLADTTQMKEADRIVKKVGVTTEETSKKVKKLGSNMRLTKGPTSALSTTAGQLGVQFQDVAVQAEAGTDAVRIFSQQGPQILSVFGPQGAVAGALLAIGLVVGKTIVDAFGLGKDAIEEFGKSTKKVGDSIEKLEGGFFGLTDAIVDLAKQSEAAAELQIALALNEAEKAADSAREVFSELGLTGMGMARELDGASQGANDFVKVLDDIAHGSGNTVSTLSLMKRASQELGISLDEIRGIGQQFVQAIDPEGDATALTGFAENLAEIAKSSGDPALQELALRFIKMGLEAETTEEQARLLKSALDDLGNATGTTSQKSIDFVKQLEQMALQAGATREQILRMQAAQIQNPELKARAEAALKSIENNKKAEKSREETADREEEIEKRLSKARQERFRLEERARRKNEAQEKRDAAQKLKDKQAEDKKAQDILRKNNETQFQIIVEAREKRIEEEEKEAERKAEQEEKFEKFMAERRKNEFQRIQDAANERREREAEERKKQEQEEIASRERVTNALLGLEDKLMKGKTEKQKAAFRLGVNLANAEKRQNAATILSDSYTAAMKAYKALAGIPFVGPALGAAAAGVIIAAGASYATQSLAGRALGGQVRDGESYVVGERGPEVLTMGSSGRIIPNDKLRGEEQVVNKTANITFQINTVDARGFDQLLQSRRGQIISMVNTAMNDKGRRGVV